MARTVTSQGPWLDLELRLLFVHEFHMFYLGRHHQTFAQCGFIWKVYKPSFKKNAIGAVINRQ